MLKYLCIAVFFILKGTNHKGLLNHRNMMFDAGSEKFSNFVRYGCNISIKHVICDPYQISSDKDISTLKVHTVYSFQASASSLIDVMSTMSSLRSVSYFSRCRMCYLLTWYRSDSPIVNKRNHI